MKEDDDIGLGNTRAAQTANQHSSLLEAELERIRRRKLFPKVELERFPYEKAFNAFVEEVQKLEAEHDKVNGISREYIAAYRLFPCYQKTFAEHALGESSIRYRFSQINPDDFPDDFIALQFTATHWEPKYFINRLNKKLLMKIYLPALVVEMKTLAEKTAHLESLVRVLLELDGKEEGEEF